MRLTSLLPVCRLLLAVLVARPAVAMAVDTKAVLQIQGATDLSHDEAHEDHWDSRDQLELSATGDANESLAYKVSARAKGDFYGNGSSEEDIDLEVYETYLKYRQQHLDLTVGNLVVQWGKMDELVLTDNVNAQDLDQFIIPWKEDRKLATPMAQAEVYLGDTTLELLVAPRPSIHRFTFLDSDWALFRHNREVGADLATTPQGEAFFRSLGVDVDAPGWGDVEVGGRLRSSLGGVDFAVSGLLYHQRAPVFRGDPVELAALFDPEQAVTTVDGLAVAAPALLASLDGQVQASYPWVITLGGEFETVVGDYGVRGEIAHTINAEYQALASDSTITVVEGDQTLFGLGVDLTYDAFYGNLQAVHQWVQEGADLLVTNKQATTLVLVLEYETLQGTLTPAFYAAWDLGDNAAYLRPRLQYKATDHITLDGGLHVFTGDEQTTLGSFDANDQVYLLATIAF